MKLLQKRWDSLEKQHKPSAVVFRWFRIHIAPIIRENMHCELLRDLGIEEEKYTQNNSESPNALVKQYQKQDIFQFVNDLNECVHEQQNQVSKAAIGLGRWSLSPSYSHIGQKTNTWFSCMSRAEKQEAISTLHAPLTVPSSSSINDSEGVSYNSQVALDSRVTLSVPYTTLSGILSDGQLKAMWAKASRLLTEKKVVKPPDSNPKTRWVVSDTAPSPHVVTTTKANKVRYVCDKQCTGWKTQCMCSLYCCCRR